MPASRKRSAPDAIAPPHPKRAKSGGTGGAASELPSRPQKPLDVYVFGSGESGELGLGKTVVKEDEKLFKPTNVKRPRLNLHLAATDVGVVQVVAGGMHCVALTRSNKILTWGINDAGALGRDTTWDGGMRDIDDVPRGSDEDSGSDDEDGDFEDMNPKECLPGQVDFTDAELPPSTQFAQVAAGDSISLALTTKGQVYGWGIFRANEGELGFSPGVHLAARPRLIPELKDITSIVAGANHALALDINGDVFAWGSIQQCQLGRKLLLGRKKDSEKRRMLECLVPRKVHFPRGKANAIEFIGTGSYHSFAITRGGNVFSWGLNNFGETGHMTNAGKDDAMIVTPTVVEALRGEEIVSIQGGSHHSIAATAEGDCITFGRFDNGQLGLSTDRMSGLPSHQVLRDEYGKPRIVAPVKLTDIQGRVVHVAADSDHNVVVTREGKAYSWGYSPCYQTGQGAQEEVLVPTLIGGAAVQDKVLNGATVGGQFGIVTGEAA